MRKAALLALATAACAGTGGSGNADVDAQQILEQPEVSVECRTQPGSEAVAERTSPFDSTRIEIAGRAAQVCYSRPAARGRLIFAAEGATAPLVPYEKLWRTGANEPTILHLPFRAELAGLALEPGSYSLYTIPGATEWTLIVNRSTSQWGHEARYTPEVQAQEVGRARVPTERLDQQVESFTIRSEPSAAGADILLEWERTRVRIPMRAMP
jgi:hypothetical protein